MDHDFCKDYVQMFQFTVNGEAYSLLEPNLTTPLDARLTQASEIVDEFGILALNWRFDPIVHWYDGDDIVVDNLEYFQTILQSMARIGVKKCTISIMHWYDKCVVRAKCLNFKHYKLNGRERIDVVSKLARKAKDAGVTIYACVAPEILTVDNVVKSSCIDGNLLTQLAGGDQALVEKDIGQREYCGCTKSVDIGSYDMKCGHNCIYCYADPDMTGGG
jgi:hypothetical protein